MGGWDRGQQAIELLIVEWQELMPQAVSYVNCCYVRFRGDCTFQLDCASSAMQVHKQMITQQTHLSFGVKQAVHPLLQLDPSSCGSLHTNTAFGLEHGEQQTTHCAWQMACLFYMADLATACKTDTAAHMQMPNCMTSKCLELNLNIRICSVEQLRAAGESSRDVTSGSITLLG